MHKETILKKNYYYSFCDSLYVCLVICDNCAIGNCFDFMRILDSST